VPSQRGRQPTRRERCGLTVGFAVLSLAEDVVLITGIGIALEAGATLLEVGATDVAKEITGIEIQRVLLNGVATVANSMAATRLGWGNTESIDAIAGSFVEHHRWTRAGTWVPGFRTWIGFSDARAVCGH
jgi:hypothetical protein